MKKQKKETHQMMVGSRTLNGKDLRDFYETPPEAIHRLFKVWKPDVEKIWEPACGKGAISEVLKSYGYDVVSTDIEDRGYGESGVDFFKQKESRADLIFTNPPFNISTEFVEHSISLASKSIFLLRLQWLESEKRRKTLFSKNNLSDVFIFSKRIPRMHMPDYEGPKVTSTIAFAWYLFDNSYEDKPRITWLP